VRFSCAAFITDAFQLIRGLVLNALEQERRELLALYQLTRRTECEIVDDKKTILPWIQKRQKFPF
jgi:ribosomal protein L30/L7E